MNSFPALGSTDFHAVLRKTPGLALVVFTTPGCGTCRRLVAVLGEYVASGDAPRVFEVRVDEDVAVARAYNVFHLPALFLFVDGEYHAEIQCEARLDALRAAVALALAAPAGDEP